MEWEPRSSAQALRSARECAETGNPWETEALCRRALDGRGNDTEALRQLAATLGDLGRFGGSLDVWREYLKLRPRDSAAVVECGILLTKLGRHAEAEVTLLRALRIRPDLASPHYHLARLAFLRGEVPRSEARLKKALRADPHHSESHLALGVLQARDRRIDEAIVSLRLAIQSQPSTAEPYWRLGDLLRRRGRLVEAMSTLSEAVALAPDCVGGHVALGYLYLMQSRIEAARRCFEKAADLDPEDARAHIGIANAFVSERKLDEAVDTLHRAITLDPDSGHPHRELGMVYRELGDFEKARELIEASIRRDPHHAGARTALASLSEDDGDLAEVAAWCAQRLAAGDRDVGLHHQRSYCLAMIGRLQEAWEHYEYRWYLWEMASSKLDLTRPVWDGSNLRGGTLFIWSEQGIGDEVMFSSLFPEALRRSDSVLVECDRRLIPLFERSFPEARFHAKGTIARDEARLAGVDRQIPAGSLPRLFRPTPGSFPSDAGYLVPEGSVVEELRGRYRGESGRPVVGLSWRGGVQIATRNARSIGLLDWKPLLDHGDVHFLSLQYGKVDHDLRELESATGLRIDRDETVDPLKDMDRFAAQVAACDLVISVDNSTVHVAGAVGAAVWVLLPMFPEWRWMRAGERSYWYPSARLFRQARPGDWDAVIERVARELETWAGSRPAGAEGRSPGEDACADAS